jgi:hypothetical protein
VPEPEVSHILEDGRRIPASGRIIVRPAIPEWQESADDYEEFIDALAGQNIKAELAEIKGIPSGADLGAQFIPEAFAIYLGVKATNALIDNIVAEAMRLIVARAKARWWRQGEHVKGVIYGPDGEIVKEVAWRSTEGRTPERRRSGNPDLGCQDTR